MKFEDIDDDSDSIFSEDPLDNIEGDEEQANEDEEKIFVRNMTTGNSYYINKSHFDKNKHELVDDSQQSSTDTQATSLVFEIADLKKQKVSLEQSAKKYKSIYDNAMRAVDVPHTNYEEIQQNRKKAEQADAYYTLALDKLKSVNAELHKKQSAYNKIGKQ